MIFQYDFLAPNIEFFENVFLIKFIFQRLLPHVDTNVDPSESSEIELRRSKRERKATSFSDVFHVFIVENDPQSYIEAMTSIDAPLWRETINSEIESIISNHTWILVYFPPNAKSIGCKLI